VVEGGFRAGEVAVVVEDVITSGGQVATSAQQLRALGLVVQHAVCVIDRQQGGTETLEAIGCTASSIFTAAGLEQAAGDSV